MEALPPFGLPACIMKKGSCMHSTAMTAKLPAATAQCKLSLVRTSSELLRALTWLKTQCHILEPDMHTFAVSTTMHDIQSKLQFASGVASWHSTACQTAGVPEQLSIERATAHKHQCTQVLCAPETRTTWAGCLLAAAVRI